MARRTTDKSKKRGRAAASAGDAKPQIKEPEHFDGERANEMLEKVIRENQEWLEEMAKK